jgi:hypothetical protein
MRSRGCTAHAFRSSGASPVRFSATASLRLMRCRKGPRLDPYLRLQLWLDGMWRSVKATMLPAEVDAASALSRDGHHLEMRGRLTIGT